MAISPFKESGEGIRPRFAPQLALRWCPEFVWGALDCPGAWAAQDPDDWRPALTGRMTVKVMDRPKVGERCAVVGWRIGADGRKLYSGTALYTEAGKLCALGTCTWIVLKD